MPSKANSTKTCSAKPFTLRLPQIFPTMTRPDTLTVLHWYVHEGDILQPPNTNHPTALLEVDAPYGEIEITVPPFLRVPHRVAAILKPENSTMHLGDQFITLEPIIDAE
ncbi:MAG: hypothetical protein ACRDIV_17555 [Ktedonobacteraceae bacterium]